MVGQIENIGAPTWSRGAVSTANNFVHQSLESFETQIRGAETTASAAMTGQANSHDLVFAISNTKLAMEAFVATRDKAVEAYQEVLRMPM